MSSVFELGLESEMELSFANEAITIHKCLFEALLHTLPLDPRTNNDLAENV